FAADLFHDNIVVFDVRTGRLAGRRQTGRRPYRILMSPDGKSYFVSSWADGTVYHHETRTGAEMARLRLGPHTTDMVLSERKTVDEEKKPSALRHRIFVTAANTNQVYVVGVDAADNMTVTEAINVGLTAQQPAGMTPSGLALSPNGERLVVACSDANVAAVAD